MKAFRLGLTGSIGMGKTTTARMFQDENCAIWDADAAVHKMYSRGGRLVEPIGQLFPSSIKNDAVDRVALKTALDGKAENLRRLEAVVHPATAADRENFYNESVKNYFDIVVFDVPLLFETGAETLMDGVAVVSTDMETQAKRVLARPGMTHEMLNFIISRQMPDAEKRAKADWVIETGDLCSAKARVAEICRLIRKKP